MIELPVTSPIIFDASLMLQLSDLHTLPWRSMVGKVARTPSGVYGKSLSLL